MSKLIPFSLILLGAAPLQAATIISLDSNNSFSGEIGPLFSFVRTGGLSGPVTISGGQFLGRNTVLLSSPTTTIQTFGNSIAAGDIFLIEEDSTGEQFDAELVFFARPQASDLGAVPVEITADSVGAVFDVSPIPEPSVALTLSLSALALLRRRRS